MGYKYLSPCLVLILPSRCCRKNVNVDPFLDYSLTFLYVPACDIFENGSQEKTYNCEIFKVAGRVLIHITP